MGLPDLPDGFFVPTADEIVARHKRDQQLLNPDIDITSGQPDMDARLAASTTAPIYSDASLIAEGINEDDATGPRLDRVGNRKGVFRGQPRGASGYVAVETAAGGATYVKGLHQLQNKTTKLRYEVAETIRRTNGQSLRVRALDTGPDTDVPAGTVLTFTNPPPGSGQQATVVVQSGGRGLTGGAAVEGDGPYRARIRAHNQNPPAGDNVSEIFETLTRSPDVPIEQPFAYPAAYGPGSCAITFTVLAPSLGASRIPTTEQVKAAWEWLVGQMPMHSYFPLVPQSQALDVAFSVRWATGGWNDPTPWPPTYASNVIVSVASGALAFTLTGAGGTVAPVAGNTLGFWDNETAIFQRKTIATVSGSNPWVVTCTADNSASDTTYSPAVGQMASPWSDNLANVPQPVLEYLATLGPGECFALAGSFQEGLRRFRQPEAPKSWPYQVGSRIEVGVAALDVVADVAVLAGNDVTVTPSVPPKLLELADLGFFPD